MTGVADRRPVRRMPAALSTGAADVVPFAGLLALSGIGFVLYPAIRPFSDEKSLAGARAFGSTAWVVAHSLAIGAFVLLGLGVFGLYVLLRDSAVSGRVAVAVALMWGGVGLTLPYYGAEVFGLHAVGGRALGRHDTALLTDMTHSIRWGAGIWFIVAGLLLLAVGAIVLATAVWRSGRLARWSGVPLAAGLALYLPQFTASQAVRVAHGVLMALGCGWLAWAMARTREP